MEEDVDDERYRCCCCCGHLTMEKIRSLHDTPDDDIEMNLILVWTVVVLNAMAFHEEIIAKRSVMCGGLFVH